MLESKRQMQLILWWQLCFLILSTTWLLAPHFNHFLSYRTSLISQYEVPSQPYSTLLRLGDFLGGSLLLVMSAYYLFKLRLKAAGFLLFIIAAGMILDPLLTTSCRVIGEECQEYYSSAFLFHAIETVLTALAFFVLALYDTLRRKKMVSLIFVVVQVIYFGLFLGQYASHARFNTVTQFLYQLIIIVWVCWFCRDFISSDRPERSSDNPIIRYMFAGWAFLNGLLAIIISFAHIHLIGRLKGLYFASDNAWLAQHGVVIGVVMLYLSRHLLRGERRARQIFLVITGVETLKYSVITPNLYLLFLYGLTFCVLFVLRDDFDRGVIPLTWRMRVQDLLFMAGALISAALVSLLVFDRDDRASIIASRTFRNFNHYGWASAVKPEGRLQSVLLAHTISAFLLASTGVILWILFRPYKQPSKKRGDFESVKTLLTQSSNSPEDYFKYWPHDKSYFWSSNKKGFIAYKITGPVVFALADPIGPSGQQASFIRDFIRWARGRRLRVCFLPIYPSSLKLYEQAGLNTLQIGSSALIDTDTFLTKTSHDKWWRWQKNRAEKAGYGYSFVQPPHSKTFLKKLAKVSNEWLGREGRRERGFALGHFDRQYLHGCDIHYLAQPSGKILAFTNEVPFFKPGPAATVDLLRYSPDANNAMPYLLFKTIESANRRGYNKFDLGFVPFAAVKNPALSIARALSGGRFSSHGLEQFKNKFDPQWQPNYMAYDGDIADLALIALNLERTMDL